MVNKDDLMKTRSLEEATELLFDRTSIGRDCIFTQEDMVGSVAKEYDLLGKSGRKETYKKLAEDFKRRTGCYGVNHPATNMNVGPILEVGCGSGLLTLELADQTNGDIIGLDLSVDMINLAQKNLARRSQERIEEIKEFWKRLPRGYQPNQEDYKKLSENPPFLDRINFVIGNAYDLSNINSQNYIVCRNALHRFQHPERALNEMYNALSQNGKIYIRDLRRDANWKTILDRIGEKRWNTQTLVQDYVGAMASMLTTSELEKMLQSSGINHFEITDGRYMNGEIDNPNNIKEYERESEYVCVIRK